MSVVFRGHQRESLQKIRHALPINKAVATGNGKNEFYRETTRSNFK
jgi:hypothetical protein